MLNIKRVNLCKKKSNVNKGIDEADKLYLYTILNIYIYLYKLIDANIKETLAIKTPDKSKICLYVKKYPNGKNTRTTIYKVILGFVL